MRDEIPAWTVSLPQLPRLIHHTFARASAPVATLTELALLRERRRTNRLLVIIASCSSADRHARMVPLLTRRFEARRIISRARGWRARYVTASDLVRLVLFFVSVCIGLYAASKVKSSADYVVAGRHLPLPFIIATVFATWFGSETVLGIPARFLNEGLHGVVADPFGSSMCLILVGLFFARPLYRMKLLTIGDYYRQRYNRPVEVTPRCAS